MPKLNLDTIENSSGSSYPEPFSAPCMARHWKKLGDAAGLTQICVNLVTLPPGCWASQRHWHTHEDEFVVILTGHPVLIDDSGETPLQPGDMCAHPADDKNGHHLINRTESDVVFLVCSNRVEADGCVYPDIDMTAETGPDGNGLYRHKDGTPYPPKA